MSLFSLTWKNVLGNFRSYALYFVSITICVVIYSTFASLQHSASLKAHVSSWEVVESILMQASILLTLFVLVFISFSNRFFTNKRKREVGLYALLGAKKKTIGKMLFVENMLLGIIAIGIGIILGSFLSRLFTMILLKLMHAPIDLDFSISFAAMMQTLLVFALIIIFTSLQAVRIIYRFKLITLFQAEKKGDTVPKPSVIGACFAIIFIVTGYWILFQPMAGQDAMARNFVLILITIVSGTYLLFRFTTVFLLRMIQKRRGFYYKRLNLVNTTQLLFHIKSNARTLTIISLLSAATLTAVSVGFSGYKTIEDDAENLSPSSYSYLSQEQVFDNQVEAVIAADQDHPIKSKQTVPVSVVNSDLSDLEYTPYGHEATDVPIKLMSLTTFNAVNSDLSQNEELDFEDNEAAIIRPYGSGNYDDDAFLDYEIVIGTNTQKPARVTTTKLLQKRLMSWSDPDVYLIVTDEVFNRFYEEETALVYQTFQVEHPETAEETSNQLMDLRTDENQLTTYYDALKKNMESAGLDIFLLGFLGLVFLIATGSIIYFKQLTEAETDRINYQLLMKMGVHRDDILRALAKQNLFVFILPLVVGIVHSSVLLTSLYLLDLQAMVLPLTIAIFGFVTVYTCYYLLTVYSSYKIVTRRV